MPIFADTFRRFPLSVCVLLTLAFSAGAQEKASELNLDSYEIIGKDTSRFTPTGDRLSTVTFTPMPLPQEIEIRTVHASEGLLPEGTVLRRGEASRSRDGLYAALDGFMGSRTAADFMAGVSYDGGERAGTVRFLSRARNENTPSHLAPSMQGVEGTGYLDTAYGNIALDLGLVREGEKALSKHFRRRDRDMSRYTAGIRFLTEPFTDWNLNGNATISGGSFRDREIPYDRSELRLRARGVMDGDIEGVALTVSSEADYSKFGAESGTLLSLGITGSWLPADRLALRGGLRFYASAMPDAGSEARLHPELNLDWMISPDMYLQFEGKSEVIRHAFSDLYRRNGLITPEISILDENRVFDISAEYGVRLYPDLLFTAGIFAWKSDNAPVFSRSGSFFGIVPDSRVSVSGMRIGVNYDRSDLWGVEGVLNFRDATWNHAGKVPYLPSVDATVTADFVPRRPWNLYSTLHIHGKHTVEKGLTDTANAFLTIDVGGERPVYAENLRACLEIRNLLNSSGAWWTDEYRLPGIGLYAGLKAHY